MTTAAFIPTIWSARFTSRLMERLPWGQYVNRSYEGELSAAGNTVKIPTPGTSITVRDYVVGTDIADAETTTGTTQDLVIDEQKYFHFLVDDVDRAQERPDQMDDAMRWAAHQMAIEVNQSMQDEFNTAYDAARSTQVSGDPVAADNTTWGKALIRAFAKTKREMTDAFIPEENRWALVSTKMIEGLEVYFTTSNPSGIWLPATQEQTLRNGYMGRLLGFALHATTNTPDGAQVGGKDTHRSFVGQGNEAVSFVNQITENEAYRPEKRFADAVKGLMVYGQKAVLPKRLYTLETQKAA